MELFDLHCDTIISWKERNLGFDSQETHFSLKEKGTLERMCQTMAVFVPDSIRGEAAREYVDVHAAYLKAVIERQKKMVGLAKTAKEIEEITAEGRCACMLAIESGAALAGKLENVEHFAELGVKMLTLVWNGENELGSGHSTEKGLTEFGKQAVKKMEQSGIIVDVSHLNDRGFADLCEIAEKPFIATHSNLRSVCSHKRNLTEPQFQEIVRRGGIVGINLYTNFLDEEGKGEAESIYRHVYRMLELGGEDVIACGSDFDGAKIHESLNSPVKFARTAEYLISRGIPERAVKKMYFENALRFFSEQV